MALLLAFALMFNNGTTVALAMCQHEDVQAHAGALASADQQIASGAAAEEAAERSVTHSKTFSDGSPASAVAFVIPSGPIALMGPRGSFMSAEPSSDRVPPGGSIAPLLRPPLG